MLPACLRITVPAVGCFWSGRRQINSSHAASKMNISKQITEIYVELGTQALSLAQDALADRFLKEALREAERLPATPSHVAETARQLARIYTRSERFEKSLSLLQKAYQIYANIPSCNSLSVAVLLELAELAGRLSRPKGAMQYRRRAQIQSNRASRSVTKRKS
jgi:tetratricopeptide (TPR) repeat protein